MWKFISTSCPARRLQPVGGIFLFQFLFLFAFKLLDALFWSRKIFGHCAAQLFNCLAYFLTNIIMRSVCIAFALYMLTTELFFSLCCAEQIGGKFGASHVVKNLLAGL